MQTIHYVSSFRELVDTPFQGTVNAHCWRRPVLGNYEELVLKLGTHEHLQQITEEDLQSLQLSNLGILARQQILSDLQLLQEYGAAPQLNSIAYYERDDAQPFFPTDVYSYHVDRSPLASDTFLCTYYGACSEILANEDAEQKIRIPELRDKLRENFKGSDVDFEDYLTEHFYDLHYRAKPNAVPLTCGIGELWRLSVDHPNNAVLPCIHRAPQEKEGERRLLLIC